MRRSLLNRPFASLFFLALLACLTACTGEEPSASTPRPTRTPRAASAQGATEDPTPPPLSATATDEASAETYTIQRGDTLGTIATRYGTTVDALVAENDIADPNRIEVGEVLRIPSAAPTSSVPLVTILNPQLNARSGPGTNYPILTTLAAGDKVPALAYSPDRAWVQVVLPDGQQAWMSAAPDFVQIDASDALQVAASIAPPPAAAAAPAGGTTGGTSNPTGNPSTGSTGNPIGFSCDADGCQQPPNASCPIKGNINWEGDKIYHLPGWRNYNDTRIDLSRGERWFCTEQEAINAGWRAPLNR